MKKNKKAMEKLFNRHVFAYWKEYKRKNKKHRIEDVIMMDHFKTMAAEHMLAVLREGMTIVYDNDGALDKGTIQSIIDRQVLVNDKLVSIKDIYYVM